MNSTIPELVALELRKQVERAVRPVRAGKKRKLAMRQELLAHLTALFQEERDRPTDDQTALQAVFARFGEPAALTQELNESVGWTERWAYRDEQMTEQFGRVIGWSVKESTWQLTMRQGLWSLGIVLFQAAGIFCLVDSERWAAPADLSMLGKFLAVEFFSFWAVFLAVHTTYRALALGGRYSWLAGAMTAWLWSPVLIAISTLFWWSIAFRWQAVPERIQYIALGSFAILPLFFLIGAAVVYADKERQRPDREWSELELGES